jgi:hypothetical protein
MPNGDEAAPGDKGSAEEQANKHVEAFFFFARALQGEKAWNAWRRDKANKDVRVTFAGIIFSEPPWDGIDFSRFEFGDDADFSGCEWCGVDWKEVAKDPKAFKTGRASFANAVFGDGADFTDVVFGDSAVFDGATFGNDASFNGAAFGWKASFASTIFKGIVEFLGTPKEQSKRHKGSWAGSESGPDRFLTISFANARFDQEAVFSGRCFEADADFTDARFYYPPDFDAVAKASRIDFTGAHIGFVPPGTRLHFTTTGLIPVRLRAFRRIAEETKNHDLERDLYIEERKAERGVYWRRRLDDLKKAPDDLKKNLERIDEQQMEVWSNWRHRTKAHIAHVLGIAAKIVRLALHSFWIAIMAAYWLLADYGRSVAQPFALLVVSVPLFYWRYSNVLAQLMHEAGPANADKYNQAIWMLAFGNAAPFVGPLTVDAEIKKFLFCPGFGDCLPVPPGNFQVWLVVQNVVSIILVFFIGLALRNYFKIK